MSKFNHFIRQINDIAAEAFKEYAAAETAYKNAESKKNAYPRRNGLGADYTAKSARYEADYAEALAAYDKFHKNGFYGYRQRMNEVRKEFVAAVESHFTADPAALDMATLELLKSGILKPAEYNRLMDKAINDNNHTMARMIGQHAKAAAENAIDRDTATALRSVSYKSNGMNGSNYVEAFDFVTGLYDRCSRNPALYGSWNELAGEVIEKF